MSRRRLCALVIVSIGSAAACHQARPPILPSYAAAPAAVPLAAPPRAAPRPPDAPPAPPRATPPAVPAETALSEDEVYRRTSLDALNAQQPLTDVFFAFDQSALSDADRQALAQDARWLRRWPQAAIEIDGYADDRGTDEYNLALGDRRARAAEDYLVGLGVGAGRIRIVSFGRERGFCHDENEACWRQNRRGHFVITAK